MTGFAPTTLRFYEEMGVLAAPERTASGYRVYGDRDVERLRLIARAKGLGCTLQEITALVQAWDVDECRPVKHQLRSLVKSKVADVQRHIAEQVAFAAQLQTTAKRLAGRPVDGPCDDSCGCTVVTAVVAAEGCATGCGCSTGMVTELDPVLLLSSRVATLPPIACTLAGGDMAVRITEWQVLLEEVEDRLSIPDGVRLVFGAAAPLAEISRLATAEYDCCSFFAFVITVDGRGIALEVTAPTEGRALLESVFGVPA